MKNKNQNKRITANKEKIRKITIIGYGELGRAIHKVLGNKKDLSIEIWDKKGRVSQKTLNDAVFSAEAVFVCVPSWCVREVLLDIKKYLAKNALVVCFAKGIEAKTLKFIDELLIGGLLPNQPIAIMSGPMLAEELMAGKNGFAVMAVKNKKQFMVVSDIFNGTSLKIKYSNDLRGVAVCGVLKNIYTLGLGMCDGLNLGSNTKGKLTIEAIKEMADIVSYLGGNKKSVWSEAGVADLIATAFSNFSRNREVGEMLAKTGICCLESEGFKSIDSVSRLLGKRVCKLPFFNILKSIVLENKKPAKVFEKFPDILV